MKPNLDRRYFIKTIGAGTAFLAVSPPLYGLKAYATNPSPSEKDLFQLFMNPPADAKPFYRWWWNGNRVTKEGVQLELEQMKAAGAGGVEINPVALHDAVENPTAKPLEWLSNEWIEVLQTAIEKGRDLDMISDMIIGTGWPFGGKFLENNETIQGFDLFTEKIQGPTTYTFNKSNLKENAEIRQARLNPVPLNNLSESKDILSEIKSGKVKVPSGEYEIVVTSWRNKFREVMYGAPGGDGPVLDHFNKTAVEKYLNRTSDGLKPYLGENLGRHIRSMFCDSIELESANWTGDFRQEFEKRNGYDLWPYFPLILNSQTKVEGDFADTLLRVRYDYYSTLAQLFMERFILPYHKWCQKIRVKSRYQAYGHPWIPTDLLAGNMVPDIPESDQWLFNAGWTATPIDQIRYAVWNKYTSSAAHLRGLKVASCEAMTNTSGVFSASLEYIKQATDLNIITGINHLVLHGWNYSPPEAGFPGWMRFGTYFSEQNPWYPYLKRWSDYAARLSAVFQNAQAVSQVAIIGPTDDHWGETGLDRNPILTEPWYLHSIWQAMNHHGYCSDYLNPQVFQDADYKNGRINYGSMSYQALIVCDMQSAFPEFIDALRKYADTGGKIIFVGRVPSESPGMKYKNNTAVAEKMNDLLNKHSENIMIADEPNRESIVNWAGELLSDQEIKPGVKISDPDDRLFIYQAENESKPVFFFSNQNRGKSIAFNAGFDLEGFYTWQWDAETGEKKMYSNNQNNISIQLKPLEALLLVFDEEKGDVQKAEPTNSLNETNISQNWDAEFITPEGNSFRNKLLMLQDLTEIPKLKDFGGTIIYRKKFSADGQTMLDLGKVAETAEVTLNGQVLGVKWWGEKTFDISNTVRQGENNLEIKVTTLLWNYCNAKSREENPMAKIWAEQNKLKENKPLPTGLIGPVIIS
ncbi:MAG: glycosyl hydrolase [Prolixibacteraceae bacterium]